MMNIKVIKKDGTLENFDKQKIINACYKASRRALDNLTDNDYLKVCNEVSDCILSREYEDDCVPVEDIHSMVEATLLELYPKSGESYRQYRNYKKDFVHMMDDVYTKSQGIRYIGDVSNANTDSTMISTQRSLIYGELNKNLYDKFFLTVEEKQAARDGYIYIHDKKDRLDSINCCLFDMANVLKGGFEMGNQWYTEPKSLDVAFDVISDITMSAASQQYGGFTIPEIDKILAPYAKKSYETYKKEYKSISDELECSVDTDELAHNYAMKKVRRDFEQGFQSWEMAFNTVGSSRGDYPFIATSFGVGTGVFETMASSVALDVRKHGQGKNGFKRPVLFPKLTFLYDENLHTTNVIVGKPKTDCSIRTIPISNKLLEVLKSIKKEYKGDCYILSGKDKCVEPRDYEYFFKTLLKKLKIKPYKFHILRHTFASKCVEIGMDTKSLSEILGHSNVNITLNIYVHSNNKIKKKYLEKL